MRFRACATAAALGPKLGEAPARSHGRGDAAQQHIEADQHQHEDRDGRLEKLPANAYRDVTRIGEQQMSQESAADQRERGDCCPLHEEAVPP